jgi:rare lipoprotein A
MRNIEQGISNRRNKVHFEIRNFLFIILRFQNTFNIIRLLMNKSFFLSCGVLFALCIIIFGISACSPLRKVPPEVPPLPKAYEIDGKKYYPLDESHGFIEEGVASWYGDDFHGKKTANGEIYNMYAMTAAHKTLPLGTVVEVNNLENEKKTVVRVNDRGPYVGTRIIDLSYEAATQIGMVRNGTAKVKIVTLGTDDMLLDNSNSDAFFTGDFTIQAGAFSQINNAEKLKQKIEQYVDNVQITPFDKNGMTFYRVRAGKYSSLKKAQCDEKLLIDNGFTETFVVSRDL